MVVLASCGADNKTNAVKGPTRGETRTLAHHASTVPQKTDETAAGLTASTTTKKETPAQKFSGIRIGSFKRPSGVPRYTILEDNRHKDKKKDVRVARLLVDTQVHKKAGFTLITRDLKARYARYDAISVEFTDTTVAFTYNGGALIFNTPAAAYFMGYVYGPPNDKGYIVQAAD